MRELEFTVDEKYNGAKVQTFLRNACGVSYRLLVRLKRVENGITADGVHIRTIDRLKAGSVVKIRLPEDALSVESISAPLDIVFEDSDILIINKPPFTAVHPSPGHNNDTLANAVCAYYESKNEVNRFRPVYRLDRDTSGLILIAKNTYASSRLNKNVNKFYYAVCQGIIECDGTVNEPIAVAEGHTIQRQVRQDGQPSVTHYRPIKTFDNHTLLELRLETGRTHQIRVHMSYIGHPLAGDDMYGGSLEKINRQALHCGKIFFTHPATGEELSFTQQLPDDIISVIGGINI